MTQIALPIEISIRELTREKTLGGAIGLCVKAAGLEPKDVQLSFKWDKGQFSRWESGDEGIKWPKFVSLMDHCGNDAPLLWMLHDRGYDVSSVRKMENELQRENRLLKERVARMESERAIELRFARDLRIAA